MHKRWALHCNRFSSKQKNAEECVVLHHMNVFPAAQAAKQAAADELRALAEAHAAQAADAAAEAERALAALANSHVCELAQLRNGASASAEAALVRAAQNSLPRGLGGATRGAYNCEEHPHAACSIGTLHACRKLA